MSGYKNITEVKRANKAIGHHWFDRKTVEYHGTKIKTPVIGGHYWVESEWENAAEAWDHAHSSITSDANHYNLNRVYRAVAVDPNGAVMYLHDGAKFDTLAEAKAIIDAIIEGRDK